MAPSASGSSTAAPHLTLERARAAGMTELAIYDMDKTITRVSTYVPFLMHAMRKRAPWRALLLPPPLIPASLMLPNRDTMTLKSVSSCMR